MINRLAADVISGIRDAAANIGDFSVMEVCGTHTASIHRAGLKSIMPDNIKFVSGPGCPVCVTPNSDIAAALEIAKMDGVIMTSFGDMLRVPCNIAGTLDQRESLLSLYENRHDVRIITSPLDALRIAAENPDKEVVFFAVGFETTAPITAALVDFASKRGIENLSVLCAHKTMPAAIFSLLSGRNGIDALLCPGHVAVITGSDAFGFIPEKLGLPAAVAGFESIEILAAVLALIKMKAAGEIGCVNMYPSAVKSCGNESALSIIKKIFEPSDAVWRGLGQIKDSGLSIRENYSRFDACKRFRIEPADIPEPRGCLCPAILRGEGVPEDCAYFGKICTPDSPLGPCMVSSEGCCNVHINYGG